MDFSISSAQKALQEKIIEFARAELTEDLVTLDKNAEFSENNWKKCSDFGLLALSVPEEYGGRGEDHLTVALAMEAFGYACRDNGLALAINGQRTIQEIRN